MDELTNLLTRIDERVTVLIQQQAVMNAAFERLESRLMETERRISLLEAQNLGGIQDRVTRLEVKQDDQIVKWARVIDYTLKLLVGAALVFLTWQASK